MILSHTLMSVQQNHDGSNKIIRGRAIRPTSLYGVEDEKFINKIEKFGIVALSDSI